MRYKLLGKSGLRVSELCLGTMTFGEDWGWGSSKDESRKVYDAFREAGGNFIDTANVYTNGTSETLLGEFMRGHRDKVVLATKYTNAAPGDDPNAAGNHRKSMVQALEASLKRLNTDYIDLYWLHIWDQITPDRGSHAGLRRPRAPGESPLRRRVRHAGLGRGEGEHAGRTAGLDSVRRASDRVQPDRADAGAGAAADGGGLGLGVTAWSPLAGGMLTGKQLEAGGAKDSRQNDPMMQPVHGVQRPQGGGGP